VASPTGTYYCASCGPNTTSQPANPTAALSVPANANCRELPPPAAIIASDHWAHNLCWRLSSLRALTWQDPHPHPTPNPPPTHPPAECLKGYYGNPGAVTAVPCQVSYCASAWVVRAISQRRQSA
jgi:hypothetical protein